MKTITRLSLIVLTGTGLASGTAFADDSQLKTRLAHQRQAVERNQKSTTVGVYADRRGVSQRHAMEDQRTATRFEMRTNARGQQFGVFVPVK